MGRGGTKLHLLADTVPATAGPALVVEATVRTRNRLTSALAFHEEVGSGTDSVHASAGLTLVVEAAVRAADGRAAPLGSCKSGEGHL
jgi:hypothetical protein